MHSEFFDFLVQRKTRRLSCDLKEHAAGFAEIDGMKISAIDDWRDVVAEIDKTLAPLKLFGLILGSKRNVMHRTSGHAARRAVWLTQQVDNSARSRIVGGNKPESISGFIT